MKSTNATKTDVAMRLAAVVLMLAGAAMLIAGRGEGVAFPGIAIGVALTVALLDDKRRRHSAGDSGSIDLDRRS